MKRPLLILLVLGCSFGVWAVPDLATAKPADLPVKKTDDRKLPWENELGFELSPDGKWVVSCSSSRIKLWKRSGELVRKLESARFSEHRLMFAPDSRRLFVTSPQGTTIYAVPSGQKVREIEGAELSVDGRFFVRHVANTLQFVDALTGRRRATIKLDSSSDWPSLVEKLSFSPDGNLVAQGPNINSTAFPEGDARVWIWNLDTGKLVATLSDARGALGRQMGIVGPVLWSRDSKTLVTGGDVPNWRVPMADEEAESHFDSLNFHTLTVKVWDASKGKLLHVWPEFGSTEEGVPLRSFVSSHEVNFYNGEHRILDIWTGKTRTANAPIASK